MAAMTSRAICTLLSISLALRAICQAAGPLVPFDRLAALSAEEAQWIQESVPLFDCPDKDLQEIYYFRWHVYHRHLKQTPDGFVVTEFLPDVPWTGKYNTISCAAGHHFYEGRWIRDPKYLNDYATFWFRKGGEPRRYSFWTRTPSTPDIWQTVTRRS